MVSQAQKHKCGELEKLNKVNVESFEKKHPDRYYPTLGISVLFEAGEWILTMHKEFGSPIIFCPFCGKKLVK